MIKRYILRITIFIVLLVFLTPITQAQDWFNSNITTIRTNVRTDTEVQKIKAYNDSILIGISKINNFKFYDLFVCKNNSTTIYHNYITDTNIIVSDIAFLGDSVYFCGKIILNALDSRGIIGRTNIDSLIGNINPQYDIDTITDTQELKQLAVHRKPYSNDVILCAIGNNGYNLNPTGRFVFMHFSPYNPVSTYDVFEGFSISSNTQEIFEDICITDSYVVTLSHVHPKNTCIIRCYDMLSSLTNLCNYAFDFQNITINHTSNFSEFPLHISALREDTVAIAFSGIDNQTFFTMINILNPTSNIIQRNQLIYFTDKENKILEMDYSIRGRRLLVLSKCNLNSSGATQTVTLLNPNEFQPYTTEMEYFPTPFAQNHICAMKEKQYALAGTYTGALSSNFQSITTKLIDHQPTSFLSSTQILTGITNTINGYSITNLSNIGTCSNIFVPNNFLHAQENLTSLCNE